MCGVFGFIGGPKSGPSLKTLERVAIATQARGVDAFGFAWLDRRGRLRSYKQTGRISDALPLLAMLSEAKALIGHCRYATHGTPENNLNNHPHPCDGGWIVHNGVVARHEEINDYRGFHPVTECDTETLAMLVETMDGTLPGRCSEAVAKVGAPNVLLGLWRPGRVIAVRNGNPLHYGIAREGVYLASLSSGLPGVVKMIADAQAVEFRCKGGFIHVRGKKIARRKGRGSKAGAGPAGVRSRVVHRGCGAAGDTEPERAAREVRRGC